jgi:NAD(P)-dependent dehydrogenase (short-subunit alcohol dehydrogenase family)
MDLRIAGDVAVVVGGAQGLGQAIAAAFVVEGAKVALVDRDAKVASVAQELEATSNAGAIGLAADVTDLHAIRTAAATIQDRFGRSDHVVFAAAVGSGRYDFPFWNLEPGDWPRVLEVNLVGAINVAHTFAPAMAAAHRGTFLFLGSVAGQIGSPTDPPYSASKAGLINFAQCAARDLAPFGVRVNTLCPGMVRTAMNRSIWQAWVDRQPADLRLSFDDWAAEKIGRLIPLGRWQEPEDIAAMAVFLASPRAANITGQTINVDGGYVMHW